MNKVTEKGKLYGIGIGPGDPELLTLKALRVIKESDIIAVPGENPKETVAYIIVKGAYPELDEKEIIGVNMPMIKDHNKLNEAHEAAAKSIENLLDEGKNVAFLTLGDVCVYSTYIYVHKRVLRDGYEAEIISGIPSFCATAARLNISLVERDEALHVIPGTYKADSMDEVLKLPGTKVIMKGGKKIGNIRESIIASGQQVNMIENCGMENEGIYRSAEEIPDDASYFSLLIVKDEI